MVPCTSRPQVTAGPGDAHSLLIVGDGRARTQLGHREYAGFSQITLAGTWAIRPQREAPDLVEGVELRDLEPVSREDITQRGIRGYSPAHLLEYDLSRPALLVDQQVTKDIQRSALAKWLKHMASSTRTSLMTAACSVTALRLPRCPQADRPR